MNLLSLRSLQFHPLPIIGAVSELFAAPQSLGNSNASVLKIIGQNIQVFSNPFQKGTLLDSRFSEGLLLGNLPSFKELFETIGKNYDPSHLSQFFGTSLPLSVAVEKFNPSSFRNIEGASSSLSNTFLPQHIFQTSLPLSLLKELQPRPLPKESAKGSTPNRQPYEKRGENKKPQQGMVSLFGKYLRRTKH